MKKRILIIIFATLSYVVWGQNYQFIRGSINSGSCQKTSNIYSSESSLAETAAGKCSSTSYHANIGFLHTTTGEISPVITNIQDVPNDQGHQVVIEWVKSALDDNSVECYYHLWRRNSSGGDWGNIETLIANGEEMYQVECDTSADSTQANPIQFDFKIVFQREVSYFESNIMTGCSQDNIPPDIVENVDITISENSVNLQWEPITTGTWNEVSYPELNGIWYKIYMGDQPDFICNATSYSTTTQNAYYNIDLSATTSDNTFFKIVVIDKP